MGDESAAAVDGVASRMGKAPVPTFPNLKKISRECYKDPTMNHNSLLSQKSGEKKSEQYSFSKDARFKWAKKEKSSPRLSHQASMQSTTCSGAGGLLEASQDLTSAGPSHILDGGPSLDFTSAGPSTMFDGGPSMDVTAGGPSLATLSPSDDEYMYEEEVARPSSFDLRHPRSPETDKLYCTRLESSLLRLEQPYQRAALPRAKSYEPAKTVGADCSAAYNRSPHFSFGGGKSRCPDPKNKEHLAHIAKTFGATKGKGKPNPVTLMDLKDAVISKSRKTTGCFVRGFGSEPRLNTKTGPNGPIINGPGPGGYELARACDPEPVWLANARSKSAIWSKRTSERKGMRAPTSNPPNIGPGDHIADHPFKPGGPSPVFGHPAKDMALPNWEGLDPMRYSKGSTLSTHHEYSIGKAKRPGLSIPKITPSPDAYGVPSCDLSYHHAPPLTFGKSERQHPSDMVDPDEPPGPGSHWVRVDPKASDKPSAGLGKDERGKVPLPFNGPGPGHYPLPSSFDPTTGKTQGMSLPRPIKPTAGPTATHENDLPTRQSSPAWGELGNRTSTRKPPWRVQEQPPVFEMKSGEKLMAASVPNDFKPTGPRWKMAPRRPERKWDVPMGLTSGSESMAVSSCFG